MSDPTDINPDRPGSEPPHEAADEPRSAAPSGGREDGAPGLTRPVIAVSLLTAHPGNVRRDLDLSPEFLASIKENGVLVPLRITADADGAYRVIDGHRRLAAAVQAGLAEVPVDLADDRAGDEPGQFLDMWVAHRHRNPLAPLEEADALFAARAAGATKARIRKATGLKPPQVTAALAAATLSEETRASVQASAAGADLGGPGRPGRVRRTTPALSTSCSPRPVARHPRPPGRTPPPRASRAGRARTAVRRTRRGRGHRDRGTAHRAGSCWPCCATTARTSRLNRTPAVPGRGAFFRSYDLDHACALLHRPSSPRAHASGTASLAAGPGAPAQRTQPGPAGSPEHGPPDAARRLVIQGNKAWKAAGEVRKRWLAGHLFARRTAPREAAQFVAQQLLTMPDPLRSGLAAAHSRPLFAEITGKTADAWEEACGTVAAGRLPLLMLAPIATAYEQAMTEGEGKNTWRTDRYSPCPRREAGRYFAFLASIGYQLADIEQAVADSVPYAGDTPPDEPLPGATDGDGQEDATEPGSVDEENPNDSGHRSRLERSRWHQRRLKAGHGKPQPDSARMMGAVGRNADSPHPATLDVFLMWTPCGVSVT